MTGVEVLQTRQQQQVLNSLCNNLLLMMVPPITWNCYYQWCIAKNRGGYMQRGMAKGLKVPCLFMITEVSIRCPKKPGGWYTAYTPQYTTGYY